MDIFESFTKRQKCTEQEVHNQDNGFLVGPDEAGIVCDKISRAASMKAEEVALRDMYPTEGTLRLC